jgi:hypothetical protein
MRHAAASAIAIEDIEYNLWEVGRQMMQGTKRREQSAGSGVCCALYMPYHGHGDVLQAARKALRDCLYAYTLLLVRLTHLFFAQSANTAAGTTMGTTRAQ